jgi:hypothetical protein
MCWVANATSWPSYYLEELAENRLRRRWLQLWFHGGAFGQPA